MPHVILRLASNNIIYEGTYINALKTVIYQITPPRCRIQFVINTKIYTNLSNIYKIFQYNDTIDITVIITRQNECSGKVVVDCRGGPTVDTIVTYYVEPCTNLTNSSNSFVCSRCKRITMNLCCKEPTVNYNKLNNVDFDEGIIILDDVSEICTDVDCVLSRMSYHSRIKYYIKSNKMFENDRKYNFCKRNQVVVIITLFSKIFKK